MKVVIVCDTFPPYANGGTTRQRHLCKYLLSQGHTVEYFCGVPVTAVPKELLNKEGFRYHKLPSVIVDKKDLPYCYFFPPSVISYLIRGDYDLLYLSGYLLPLVSVTILQLLGLVRKPVIVAQEINLIRYSETTRRNMLSSPGSFIYGILFFAFWFVFRIASYLLDCLIVGPTLNEGLYSSTIFSSRKVFKALPTGVSSIFKPSKNKLTFDPRKDVLRFLYLGRLTTNKDIEGMGDFLDCLVRRGIKFKWTLVGQEEANYKSRLAQAFRRYLSFIEFQDPVIEEEKVLELYQSHHFTVQPSKTESFGLTIFESFASGTPCFFQGNYELQGLYAGCLSTDGVSIQDYCVDFHNRPEQAVDIIMNGLGKTCPNFNTPTWEEASSEAVSIFHEYVEEHNQVHGAISPTSLTSLSLEQKGIYGKSTGVQSLETLLSVKTIFIVAVGTRGDVQPLISFAAQLLQTSKSPLRIVIYAHSEYESFAKSLLPPSDDTSISHVTFRPLDPSIQLLFQNSDFIQNPFFPKWDWDLAKHILASWFNILKKDVLAECPNVFISTFPNCTYFCYLNGIFRKTKTQHLVFNFYPCLPTGLYPPHFVGFTLFYYANVLLWYVFFWLFHIAVIFFSVGPVLPRVGIPPPKNLLSKPFLNYVYSGEIQMLNLFDPQLGGTHDTALNCKTIGYPQPGPTGHLDNETRALLLNSPRKFPIIYVGFGSCIDILFRDPRKKLQFFDLICHDLCELRKMVPFKVIIHYGGTGIVNKEMLDDLAYVNDLIAPTIERILSEGFQEGEFLIHGSSMCHPSLFPQIDVAVHQGGAGISHVAVSSKTASVVFPGFPFIDQRFWGTRIAQNGLGSCGNSLGSFESWPKGHFSDKIKSVLSDIDLYKTKLDDFSEQMKKTDPATCFSQVYLS